MSLFVLEFVPVPCLAGGKGADLLLSNCKVYGLRLGVRGFLLSNIVQQYALHQLCFIIYCII